MSESFGFSPLVHARGPIADWKGWHQAADETAARVRHRAEMERKSWDMTHTYSLSLLYWVTLKTCVLTGLLLIVWKAFILSFMDRAVDSIIDGFLMSPFFLFICFVIENNNYCQMPQLILSPLPLSCRGLCVFPPSSLISIVKIAAAAELKKKKSAFNLQPLWPVPLETRTLCLNTIAENGSRIAKLPSL